MSISSNASIFSHILRLRCGSGCFVGSYGTGRARDMGMHLKPNNNKLGPIFFLSKWSRVSRGSLRKI